MRQVFRRVLDSKGSIQVEEVPSPGCGPNQVLVDTRYTVISVGTEGATLSKTFPELVKQSLQDPWMRNAVKNLILGASPVAIKNIVWDEITQFRAIGYSGSGIALQVGENVSGIKPGDKVAFAAQGHAEIVASSGNLTVPVPVQVSLKDAAFVTLGGIAMQGVRRAEIQLGEKVVVIGLGLVGQIVAQLVNAAGGHVIGIDVNRQRLNELQEVLPHAQLIDASSQDPVQTVMGLSGNFGADAVIICAASKSPVIANQAMKMSRKQGRVVFVGIVKMDLERMPFFRNELDLRFSRAYGPGSYDRDYDTGRIDYPQHYVRWTEKRNLEEFIQLLAENRVKVNTLIGDVCKLEDAQKAYDALLKGSLGKTAALLEYKESTLENTSQKLVKRQPKKRTLEKITVGIIGCGNFTRSTHVPNLHKNSEYLIKGIASATGTTAASIVSRYGIEYSTTDYKELLSDPDIDAVLIATRHDLHGSIACEALEAGKHVFVEKPAVLDWKQHNALKQVLAETDRIYMVGYNRRFAPLAVKLKTLIDANLPLIINYHVCIPEVPADHWTLNKTEGGGRLVGEAEHFFDFSNFLAGGLTPSVSSDCILIGDQTPDSQYNFIVNLNYDNHAMATITYTSYAVPGSPREKITVFQGQKTMVMEDFKKLTIHGSGNKTHKNQFGDMGHQAELKHFAFLIKGNNSSSPIELLAPSGISLTAMDLLNK